MSSNRTRARQGGPWCARDDRSDWLCQIGALTHRWPPGRPVDDPWGIRPKNAARGMQFLAHIRTRAYMRAREERKNKDRVFRIASSKAKFAQEGFHPLARAYIRARGTKNRDRIFSREVYTMQGTLSLRAHIRARVYTRARNRNFFSFVKNQPLQNQKSLIFLLTC